MKNALQKMIELDGDLERLIGDALDFLRGIQKLPANEGLISLVRISNINNALSQFLDGTITEEQLQQWADVLEMCDYVEYESDEQELIADVLFRLSTPEINEPINHVLARKLQRELKEQSP